MKKIILSVAVATMALSTAAAALEDIKVNGQAKVWYETNNAGTNDLFNKDHTGSIGQQVFKLGMTGKQGNVGFGATVYETSSMGLENTLVGATRDNSADDGMFTGELYVTAPVGAKTLVKFGKQELDTPLCFTERWQATPNTFNAGVLVNNSIDNLTLIAAYVGQSNSSDHNNTGAGNDTFKVNNDGLYTAFYDTSVYAAGALYKANGIAANLWAYNLNSVANAYWLDAGMDVSGIAVKAYVAMMDPAAAGVDETKAYAVSAAAKVAGFTLSGAVSKVSDKGALPVGNTATGFKKTKLPTAGVYTDGVYVAQMGSTAFKVKAAGKLGSTGVALQAVQNNNDVTATKETTEIDLILSQKVGDFNLKAILMDRSFKQDALDATSGGQHVRVIASVNF